MSQRNWFPTCVFLACAGAVTETGGGVGAAELPRVELITVHGKRPVPTVRRGPRPAGEGGGGGAAHLENGDFAAGLAGWTASEAGGGKAPGAAAAAGGEALLTEGDSFLVTLEQTFVVPERAGELTFRLSLDPGFDLLADFIPDAFEVSLLDAGGIPLLETWDPFATSSFNLAEDGTAHVAPGVARDGSVVRLDIGSLAPGTEATLVFDLIGADEDTGGGLRVDDVAITEGPGAGAFVRGDHDANGEVTGSDAEAVLEVLFAGGAAGLDCSRAASLDPSDANDNERITIADYQALRAAVALGSTLPGPGGACGVDPSQDRRGFDQVDPLYRVVAGELELLTAPNDPEPRAALPVLVDAPRPLAALGLILEYDAGALAPFDPVAGDGAPLAAAAAGAGSAYLLEPGRLVLAVWAGQAGGRLVDGTPGSLQRVATVYFNLERFQAVRPFRWLAEMESAGIVHRATLVDDAFADHHPEPVARDHDFVRGNANADARVDLSDAVFSLNYLFLGGVAPVCLDASDANNDSLLNITDPIYTLNFLFLGGPALASPYPECGIDAGPPDLLGCGLGACPP